MAKLSERRREVHCEALEIAVPKMTKGSAALLTVEDPSICQDKTLGLAPTAGPVKSTEPWRGTADAVRSPAHVQGEGNAALSLATPSIARP